MGAFFGGIGGENPVFATETPFFGMVRGIRTGGEEKRFWIKCTFRKNEERNGRIATEYRIYPASR